MASKIFLCPITVLLSKQPQGLLISQELKVAMDY